MKMNKRDFIAIAIVTVFSVVGFFFINRNQTAGNEVLITLEGKEYGIYSLSKDKEIEINCSGGKNIVVIKKGSVCMKDADCPDKYCVKQGSIKNSGESLICLPHKLVVEVCSNNRNEIDSVAK